MATTTDTRFAHIIATVDAEEHSGKIRYVNPSNVQSALATASGATRGGIALVLRDAAGAELRRIVPEVRYDACSGHGDPQPGLIQQDVELLDGLASVDLVQGDEVLDSFRATSPSDAPEIAGAMGLESPLAGAARTRSGFRAPIPAQEGVTYLIEARPDGQGAWNTLSIGRKTPDFEIDKNQFPGASMLNVRVVQNAGFTRRIIEERDIPLE